ncbi:MAG: hypothetical protein L0154_01990 [Chloroflexi bacterium]|nr:hypothetical protein [Chloroflexota bacterium]
MATRNQSKKRQETLRTVVLVLLPIALVAFGWYNVVSTADRLESNTIRTYQAAQLEIVRNAGRAAEVYIGVELERLDGDPTQEDINRIEQEVLANFVTPITLQGCPPGLCDAWIYNPEYIIYDQSADFPAEYIGKSMPEIFEIQKESGAFHYEFMTNAVVNAEEGNGWYVWEPDKAEDFVPEFKLGYRRASITIPWDTLTDDSGREIAAWTPVTVQSSRGEEVWVIGMSSMLPVLMENNGSYDQIRSNIYTMLLVSGVVVALLGVLLRAQAQVEELRQQVQELRVEIDQTRRAEQVSEIVESEYFQDLAARARTLRERNQ